MAFGAKIKLTVDKSNQSQFRTEIQAAVDAAVKNGIKISSFKAELDSTSAQMLSKSVQSGLDKGKFTIKINKIDASNAVEDLRKQLTTMLSGLSISGLKDFVGFDASSTALERAATAAQKLAEAQENVQKKAADSSAAIKEIGQIQNILNSSYRKSFGLSNPEDMAVVQQAYREITAEIQRAKTLDGETQSQVIRNAAEAAAALKMTVQGYNEQATAAAAAKASISDFPKLSNLYEQLNAHVNENTLAYRMFKEQFDGWMQQMRDDPAAAAANIRGITSEFNAAQSAAQKLGVDGQAAFNQINSAWAKLAGYFSFVRVFNALRNALRKVVNVAKELDAAMTELRKVTDLSETDYEIFFHTAGDIAKNIGASMTETINATADFSRLGFELDDASDLAEAALMYKNIGDGINSIDDSTGSIISTMKAFKISAEDAMHIVDAFNEVGNNFAITSGGIGDALTRSASALAAAGNSLEESIGLVVAANEIIQNPESVGTALKTLSMYLRAAKTEAEEAGIETDGMASSVASLRAELLTLTSGTSKPLDIMIDENTFKSTFQILEELSGIWDELADVDQANILNKIGGKRNANVLSALITNFDQAKAAAETAANSTGSAWVENEKYLDSINGRIKDMKASFEALSGSLVNNDITKGIISFMTGVVDVLGWLSDFGLLIPGIVAALSMLNGVFKSGVVGDYVRQITLMVNAGNSANTVVNSMAGSFSQLNNAQKALLISMLQNATVSEGAAAAERDRIVTILSGASANNVSAMSFRSLATAVKTAWYTMNAFSKAMLLLSAAMAVIGLIVGITNAIKRSAQKAADAVNEMMDGYTQAVDKAEGNKDTLESLRDEFEELGKGVDENGRNVSLTSSEYERYLEIVDQIVSISPSVVQGYNDERQAVVNYTSAITDAINEQDKLIKNQQDILKAGSEDIFKIARKERNKALDGSLMDLDDIGLHISNLFLDKDTLEGALSHIGIAFDPSVWDDTSTMQENFVAQLRDDVVPFYENVDEFVKYLATVGGYDFDTQLKPLLDATGYLADDAKNAEDALTNVNQLFDVWLGENIDKFGNMPSEIVIPWLQDSFISHVVDDGAKTYTDVAEMMNGDITKFGEIWNSDAVQRLEALTNDLQSGRISIEEFNRGIIDIFTSAEDARKEVEAAYNNGDISEIDRELRMLTIATDEWAGAYDTGNYLDALDPNIGLGIHAYFSGMGESVDGATKEAEETLPKIESLTDSMERIQEGYELLYKAQEEMASGKGLSMETVGDIVGSLDEGESPTDYLEIENGIITLNTEKWKERSEAMMSGSIEALKAQREELEKERDGLYTKRREKSIDASWFERQGDSSSLRRVNNEIADIDREIEAVEGRLESTNADLLLFEGVFANIGKDPFDFTDMISGLEDVQEKAVEISDIIRELGDGRVLSMGELYNLAMEIPELWDAIASGDFDLTSQAGQIEMFNSVLGGLEQQYDSIIERQIEALKNGRAEKFAAGTLTDEDGDRYHSMIASLVDLRDMEFSDMIVEEAEEIESAFESATNAVDAATEGIELLRGIDTGETTVLETLKWLNDISQNAESLGLEPIDIASFFNVDGSVNSAAISGLIDQLLELDRIEGLPSGLAESLKEEALAAEEAASSSEMFEDAISDIEDVQSFRDAFDMRDTDPLAALNAALELAGENTEALKSILSIDEAGELHWNEDGLEDFINATVLTEDRINALNEAFPGLGDYMLEASAAGTEVANTFDTISDSIGNVQDAFDLISEIQLGETDTLEMLNSLLDLAESTGVDIGGIISSTFSGDGFNLSGLQMIADAEVDALVSNLAQIPGVGYEAAAAFGQLVREERAAAVEAEQLSAAFEYVGDAADLIENIESGEGDFADMFQTASELAKRAGVDVSTFYSDGVWNVDAVRAFGEQYIDYALQMKWISEDAANGMREMLSVAEEAKSPKIQIEAETESLAGVVSAINESTSATGASVESVSMLMNRYKDLEAYDIDKLFNHTTAGVKVNADAVRELEKEYADSKIKEYEKQVEALREQYEELGRQIAEAEVGSQEWLDLTAKQDSLANEINETATLAAEYRGLTSAYNDWMNAKEGPEDGDMYDNMTSGLESALDLLDKGLIGTNEFATYAQLFTDEDLSGKTAYEIASIFEDAYPHIKRYFTEGSEGCQNFVDDLVGLNGELGTFATYNKETGEYEIDMSAEEMAIAAKELGISQEALQAILLKLQDYGWVVDIDPTVASLEYLEHAATNAAELLKEAGVSDYEFSFGTGNIERVDEQLEVAKETLTSLTTGENALPMDSEEVKAAQAIVAELVREKQELNKPAVMNIDASGVSGDLGSSLRAVQDLQEALNTLEVQTEIGADTTQAQADVDAALATLQNQNPEILAELGIDPTSTATFTATVSNLTPEVMIAAGVDETVVNAWKEAEHSASGEVHWKNDDAAVWAFKNVMHQAHGKVIWTNNEAGVKKIFYATGIVRWRGTANRADGTAHADGTSFSGNAFVSGNWGATDSGTALMGELGPELIVRGGRFFTVGDSGAGFYRYQKGDIIFNAAQTREIFEKGKLVGAKRRGQVYADGTAYAEGTAFAGATASGKFYSSSLTSKTSTKKQTKTASNSSSKKNASSIEKIKTKYEELNDTLEHLIAHQEFLYEQSERGLDYDGMRASLTEQAALYKEMMENAQAAVKEMQAKGATDATKELQDMEKVYWDAYSKFHDMLDEINALHVDALNDRLDDIQKAFDNLSSAAEEYEKHGGISVDTYQDLLEHGIQYLSLLKNQDGQYVINRESIEALIAAEKEQLALESALSYISDLQIALSEGNANMVSSLVDSSQKISDATWGNVFAQAALLQELGLTSDQYNIVMQNLQALQAVTGEVITDITTDLDDAKDSLDDLYDEQLDSLENILDLVQDLIEYETEEQIEAIEDQIDAFRELVDLKKESLQTTKDESDYEEDIAEKVKEIAEIQSRVDMLSLDDSRAARAEEAELMAELAELQKELAESQESHALDKQTEALDELADAYEESRQPEIEALENSISSAEKLYRLAIERISSGWDTLYQDLIDWNYEAGNSLNSEITDRWNAATEAVKEYGSYLEALNVLQEKTGSVTNYGEQSFVVADVNKLPRYHSGGVVGDASSINEEEVVAVLEKNEIVIDDGKKSVLYKIIDFQQALSEKLGRAIGSLGAPNAAFAFAGAGTAAVDPIQTSVNTTIHFNPQISVGINADGGLKQSDALKFGERIAQTTLDKLHEAFERKGIGSLRGSLLRQ